MRGVHLISAGICLVVLSAAGPLRKDKSYKYLARDIPAPDPISIIPVPDDTDPSISKPSLSTVLTIKTSTSTSETVSSPTKVPPPVSFRSTSYKNTTATLKTTSPVDGSSAVPFAAEGSTDPSVTGTRTSSSTATTSVLFASTTASATAPAIQETNTQTQTSSFSNTTSSRVPNETTKTDTLPTSLSTKTSVLALPKINPATFSASLSTTTSVLDLSKINSATLSASLGTTTSVPVPPRTNSVFPQFTLNNTSAIPLPTKTATSTSAIAKTTTTQTSVTSPPTATIEPTFKVAGIPSILPATLQTATSISPAQYTANLVEAQSYNTFFSTLNFSSSCTAGSIACLSGNMATCNQDGNFVISVCATGSECFAMPMDSTAGVVVECANKALASTVLGMIATSATAGVVTIPASTIEITNPTPKPAATTTSSSSTSPEVTLVTVTIAAPTLPTTTTDFITQSQANSQVTRSIAPVPAVPQVTAPPEPQTTSTFRGISIIPVTNQNAVVEKETVTVTVTETKTLRIPVASPI